MAIGRAPSPLKGHREARGWSNVEFIDLFADTATKLGFVGDSITQRQLTRWESDDPPFPRGRNRRVLEEIFSCSVADLGFRHQFFRSTENAEFDSDWSLSSLRAAPSIDDDMNRRELLLGGAALSAFVLEYFVCTSDRGHSEGLPDRNLPSISDLRLVADSLRALDNASGSERVVELALNQSELARKVLSAGHRNERSQQEAALVAADIWATTGWLLFDSGRDVSAQKYFTRALKAARNADNDLMASTALAFMSIQMANLCEWNDARNMARVAIKLAENSGYPSVTASLLTRQARAEAGAGDIISCYRTLERAMEKQTSHDGQEMPPWIDWINLGEIHGQSATCAVILGDTATAVSEIQLARGRYGNAAHRSESLHLLRVALAQAEGGDLDVACSTAREALAIGSEVGSFRFDEVKGDLIQVLRPHSASIVVSDFFHEFSQLVHGALPTSRLSQQRHAA